MATKALPGGVGLVFDRTRNQESPVLRTWELMAWSAGFAVTMTIESVNTNLSRSVYLREAQENNVQERLAHLLEVFFRVRGRRDDEIPTERGFCVPRGFVAGPPSEDERAYVAFHLENAPDVYFHVSAVPDVHKEESRLLQRSAQVEREMKQSGTQTIRKGAVQHGGVTFGRSAER